VDIVYRRELDRAANGSGGEAERSARREALRAQKIEEFRDRFANPYIAAERGFVDAVIQPRDTRKKLIQALEMLGTKREKNPPKKHGNIPL
jgi:propionyl-CoA carboxylase beta chain